MKNKDNSTIFKASERISNYSNICTVETLAVAVAMKRSLEPKIFKILILTDSSSAIQKIKRFVLDSSTDFSQLMGNQQS